MIYNCIVSLIKKKDHPINSKRQVLTHPIHNSCILHHKLIGFKTLNLVFKFIKLTPVSRSFIDTSIIMRSDICVLYSGNVRRNFPLEMAEIQGSPIAADINDDGKIELVTVDTHGNVAAWTVHGEEIWERHLKSLIPQVHWAYHQNSLILRLLGWYWLHGVESLPNVTDFSLQLSLFYIFFSRTKQSWLINSILCSKIFACVQDLVILRFILRKSFQGF